MDQAQYVQVIPGLLKTELINAILPLLEKAPFIDGRTTATEAAREVKRNLQVDLNDRTIFPQLQQIIGVALMNEPRFQTEFYASRVYQILFSKCETGMGYGWHVDSPVMGVPPTRTDIAMTVFLSDPSTYEGGELVIRTEAGETSYKPKLGDAVIYPCQYVHCVNDVKSGVRLAAVTWIQCSVRSAEQRQLLSNLKRIHEHLAANDAQSSETQLALQTWSNLLRMWAEV
ncbi:MAG TPA: Fe2+-dependent dioxygenase [Bacteroidia bacterium]|nr:Fe2+-dependent dioxygenase [Bacteroidia bacterium]